ncbi:hypothetical protein BC835DRAFT_926352 [Cytidiella melzeri]|nr:hypothetical protein BC835DRAFT_926352 [Cytidiella melzeri]
MSNICLPPGRQCCSQLLNENGVKSPLTWSSFLGEERVGVCRKGARIESSRRAKFQVQAAIATYDLQLTVHIRGQEASSAGQSQVTPVLVSHKPRHTGVLPQHGERPFHIDCLHWETKRVRSAWYTKCTLTTRRMRMDARWGVQFWTIAVQGPYERHHLVVKGTTCVGVEGRQQRLEVY